MSRQPNEIFYRADSMPRPYPAAPRAAHNFPGPPRDLFVPSTNERVGMNDQGRPSGSPLRVKIRLELELDAPPLRDLRLHVLS